MKSMRSKVIWFVAFGLVVSIVLIALDSSSLARGKRGLRVLDPGVEHYGMTYNELAGEWWNWALQFPTEQCPILDTTGEFCDLGQRGKVWFLAGSFGDTVVRECTVPPGKALFFPLVNSLWWYPEDGPTVDVIRTIANGQIDGTSVLECTVDGVSIGDLFAYRAQSQPGGFVFEVPEGSITNTLLGYEPGDRDPAVADGYWLLLAPLAPGPHVINFKSAFGDPENPDFSLDVTYLLTVAGRGNDDDDDDDDD